MPILVDLIKGAQSILPTTFRKFEAGEVHLESLRITRFRSTKTVLASGPVTSSKAGHYICQVAFYGSEDINAPSIRDRIGVRCGCKAYYFWFSEANRRAGASHGARFMPYVRKTPIDDPRFPPKNSDHVPGACKHLLTFFQGLTNSNFFKETQRTR